MRCTARVAMLDNENGQRLTRRLRRTWQPFFAHHGRFTEVQLRAIPVILDGSDALVCSPTASGKTEAAIAPLVERFHRPRSPWTILYVCPTRALVNDLFERLIDPINQLGITIRRRTGDHHDSLNEVPNILVTTPESFDSLLCRARDKKFKHVLAYVRAVLLDEIHLVHGTPRGEQVRWLLKRLDRLREYAHQQSWVNTKSVQKIALSATVPDTEEIAAAYLGKEAEVVHVAGSREIEVVRVPAASTKVVDAIELYLSSGTVSEKILVFCNSRKKVDDLSAELQSRLRGWRYQVHAHHGSIAKKIREKVEEDVKKLPKVIVVATSSLEIGVDIGDIDLVVLNGPAPDVASLLQRIGRGNRRTNKTRVMAYAASPADRVVQDAMLNAAGKDELGSSESGLQIAVVDQQLASYIYQGPKRSRKRNSLIDLCCAAAPSIPSEPLLEHFIALGRLKEGKEGIRLGEVWSNRAESGMIHSNIESVGGARVTDEGSGDQLAHGVKVRGEGTMNIGGRTHQTTKVTPEEIKVRPSPDSGAADANWSYAARAVPLGHSQPWAVRQHLGVPENTWPIVVAKNQQFIFHFGGSRRKAVLELIKTLHPEETRQWGIDEWRIVVPGESQKPPLWFDNLTSLVLDRQIKLQLRRLEHVLGRPSANRNLADEHRVLEVRSWLKLEEEIAAIQNSIWAVDPRIEKKLKILAIRD